MKGLLLDIGGVLTEDGAALPGAVTALAQLQSSGLPLRLLTNTSRRSHRQVLQELRALGFEVQDQQLITAPIAVKQYLQAQQLRPYIIATAVLEQDFADLPQTPVNAVVVFDAADGFSYAVLDQAFQYLQQGAELIAVGENRYYRSGGALHLDAGPFVRALEYAAETTATVIGKPSRTFYQAVVAEMGMRPDEVMMVGDDVDSDVQGALDAGLRACLCTSGKYRPGDEDKVAGTATIAGLQALPAALAAL